MHFGHHINIWLGPVQALLRLEHSYISVSSVLLVTFNDFNEMFFFCFIAFYIFGHFVITIIRHDTDDFKWNWVIFLNAREETICY